MHITATKRVKPEEVYLPEVECGGPIGHWQWFGRLRILPHRDRRSGAERGKEHVGKFVLWMATDAGAYDLLEDGDSAAPAASSSKFSRQR